MKNYELLNIIGEVSEDYVLAADSGAAQPRFRWQTLAACAACAALIAAAYPAWQAFQPQKATFDSAAGLNEAPEADQAPDDALIQRPGLHAFTLVEGGVSAIITEGARATKAPGDAPAPKPEQGGGSNAPAGTYIGGDAPAASQEPSAEDGDAAQDEASAQYERLLRSLGLWGIAGRGLYPDWCGGAWLDGEYLTAAIVHGFRTTELEQQILGWCGGTGEVHFTDVTYSQNHLDGLMDEIDRIFDELDCQVLLSYGVYVQDNRIQLDFFEVPSDEVLAALAELDPEGDAIYIQVFTDVRNVPADESAKGPACDPGKPAEAEPTPVPEDSSAAVAGPSVPPAP